MPDSKLLDVPLVTTLDGALLANVTHVGPSCHTLDAALEVARQSGRRVLIAVELDVGEVKRIRRRVGRRHG